MTPEQQALGETVRAVLRRSAERDVWPLLCAQVGVAALAIPESFGGLGAGLAELQVVAEELGRELVPCPFLGSPVLAAQALLECGDQAACARLLPGIAEGRVTALAWADEHGRWSPEHGCAVSTGSVLDGRAEYVLDADLAEALLVVAEVDGELGLFEVDPARAGVRRSESMDPARRLATVELRGVPGLRIGGDFRAGLRRVRETACAVLAAEQAGAAARALEITVEYTKQRQQFGRPIGGFQALKHRMADLYVLVETAYSAARAVQGAGPDRGRLAAAAKVHCSEALSTVAAEMIQLHGGIGVTWEHPAHRYFKRAHGAAQLFGQPHEYLPQLL
ncbi:acyl-CoA dehydrogenase family protein [Amycolatopsis aidingensis]|uniref:acyl-CoA dehydrogenase family protein n=1 Tax=Amycolatopsis aidingensis TaxID=2842453 RepID=UPI001C0E3B74|nr:acyl-CoA dehydrogenase family protein [Amycolatopsis aidingensis]